MKYVFLDFEFNSTTEKTLNLVCMVLRTNDAFYTSRKYWFDSEKSYTFVRKLLLSYHKKGYTFVAFGVMAEARSAIALGIDPTELRWIDLYCEHRMLLNHFDQHKYGKQLVNGKVLQCSKLKPKWQRNDGDKTGPQVNASLASACYHFLGVEINTDHKNVMRNLIISKPVRYSTEQKTDIMNYCDSDVVHLRPMLAKIRMYLKEILPTKEHKNIESYMLQRGAWAAANAVIENLGYPINYLATKRFSDSVPQILKELQKDINVQFPETPPFKFVPKNFTYSWNQKLTREWIRTTKHAATWSKTSTKLLSLSLEAFSKNYGYTHDYPRGNLGAQMVRYLKTKQSLNGFPVKKDAKRKNFWDTVGTDHRCRPFLNIYGSQSGRNQPSATGFIFLKAAWMRALVQPNLVSCMIGIDFGSEEFLIAALLSEDADMIKAYMSGDVYLYFAKSTGAVPKDATKETHGAMRDVFKTVVLATQYKMTAIGLSKTLTEKMGKEYTEDEAQDFLDDFDEAFPDFADWGDDVLEKYDYDGYLMLRDGWMLGPDNDNFRSVGNFPVQGCIGPDVRVLTEEYGMQKVRDLSGKPITVWDGEEFVGAQCVPSGKKQEVIITFTSGQKITCSPDHKFRTVSARGVEDWRNVSDFRIKECIRVTDEASDFFTPFLFDEHNIRNSKKKCSLNYLVDSMYELGIVLGRFASDGSVSVAKSTSTWIVAEHETNVVYILTKILSRVDPTLKVTTIKRENRNQTIFKINIYSANVAKQLSDSKLKTSLKFKPIWGSKELMRGFLSGYVDGDGGICVDAKGASIKVAFGKGIDRGKHATDLHKMFSVFGIQARIRCRGYRSDVVLNHRYLKDFRNKIGFLSERKIKLLKDIPISKREGSIRGRVEIVESVKMSEKYIEMYDVINCKNARFVADGLITHNSGSSILRYAVHRAQAAGLNVVITLHDALYVECDLDDDIRTIEVLSECMREGFKDYFRGTPMEEFANIRLDGKAWSVKYKEKKVSKVVGGTSMSFQKLHIDERAMPDYNKFKKYFLPSKQNDLLDVI